jgi:hypothetical protein
LASVANARGLVTGCRDDPHVQAITGFGWGFTIAGEQISLIPPASLGPRAWDEYLDLLATSYPHWTFGTGVLGA